MKPKIAALVGPTASGKSDVALRLARQYGAHILSCDSLLVYRQLNIGTAKPSAAEIEGVPHYGIDLVDLDRPFTAGDFVRFARPILDDLAARGVPVLIVGGTGFYLKALLCGIWDAPPTQPEIRERLEKEVASLEKSERGRVLHARLAKLDPDYAGRIQPNDVYRVIRALEIIEASGQPVSEIMSQKQLRNPLPYPFTLFGIQRNKLDLERRIADRANQMFARGLVAETKALLDRQHGQPPRPLLCVGYSEVIEFLGGKMTLPECRERVVISTRQLAKKQMTFFRTFPAPIHWFNFPAEEDALLGAIGEVLRG
jgi:tRNA dimethylallyltransferase